MISIVNLWQIVTSVVMIVAGVVDASCDCIVIIIMISSSSSSIISIIIIVIIVYL